MMSPSSGFRRCKAGLRGFPGFAGLALTIACALAPVGAAHAQNQSCARLQAEIAALGRGDAGRATQYERAAQKQRNELDRTTAYANSLGCGRRKFLFFGDSPPAQCGQIEAHIERMRINLDQLQSVAERSGGGANGARRDLMARFDVYCRGGQGAAPPQRRGFFESLFGGPEPEQPQYRQVPLEPEPETADSDEPEQHARAGSKAVCVRSCDGGFFPVSYSANRRNLEALNDLCHALCPNAETNLYTYSAANDIDTAVSIDGEPYTSLPTAGRYRQSFDPSCTCKPPGQSWVQALAEAEQMLGNDGKSDEVVTREKAEELSRPSPGPKPKSGKTDATKPDPRKKPAVEGKPVDDAAAADSLLGAQAPTASNDSAGISPGATANRTVIDARQGKTTEVVGPGGVKRKVRIISPML